MGESAAISPGRVDKSAYWHDHRTRVDDHLFLITCPYCGEGCEIYLEPDVHGTLVQDCEVCCNPWLLRVTGRGDDRDVSVSRADGSE
jgi:hypothetical protein